MASAEKKQLEGLPDADATSSGDSRATVKLAGQGEADRSVRSQMTQEKRGLFEIAATKAVPLLRSFFIRRGVAREEADVLTQDVLVVLCKKLLETGNIEVLTRPWRTARRLLRCHRNKQSKTIPFSQLSRETVEEVSQHLCQKPSQNQDLCTREFISLVKKAAKTLPPRQRRVFESVWFNGNRQEEVAKDLGTSLKNLRNTERIARQRIARILKDLRE